MRQPVVLDTNILSFELRGDKLFQYYKERTAHLTPVITVQTYEEIWFGGQRDGWGKRRLAELSKFLKRYEVIVPDDQIARASGEIRAVQRRRGMTLSTADAWIVATALTLDCPLASHDGGLASVPDLKLVQAPDARA